jgi:hypothetical protein
MSQSGVAEKTNLACVCLTTIVLVEANKKNKVVIDDLDAPYEPIPIVKNDYGNK